MNERMGTLVEAMEDELDDTMELDETAEMNDDGDVENSDPIFG